MTRALVPLGLALFLSAGCVPVTEPVGDIDKAEVDEALVGTWVGNKEAAGGVTIKRAPEVKGNPKGLMCLVYEEDPGKVPVWFFLATVGKERYANGCAVKGATGRELVQADFSKEGEYAKWARSADRRYAIFRVTRVKNELVFNYGDSGALRAAMDAEKIAMADKLSYNTAPGWLAKHLDKNGLEKLFPVTTDENALMKVGK